MRGAALAAIPVLQAMKAMKAMKAARHATFATKVVSSSAAGVVAWPAGLTLTVQVSAT